MILNNQLSVQTGGPQNSTIRSCLPQFSTVTITGTGFQAGLTQVSYKNTMNHKFTLSNPVCQCFQLQQSLAPLFQAGLTPGYKTKYNKRDFCSYFYLVFNLMLLFKQFKII